MTHTIQHVIDSLEEKLKDVHVSEVTFGTKGETHRMLDGAKIYGKETEAELHQEHIKKIKLWVEKLGLSLDHPINTLAADSKFFGSTILHLAVHLEDNALFRILLEFGADPFLHAVKNGKPVESAYIAADRLKRDGMIAQFKANQLHEHVKHHTSSHSNSNSQPVPKPGAVADDSSGSESDEDEPKNTNSGQDTQNNTPPGSKEKSHGKKDNHKDGAIRFTKKQLVEHLKEFNMVDKTLESTAEEKEVSKPTFHQAINDQAVRSAFSDTATVVNTTTISSKKTASEKRAAYFMPREAYAENFKVFSDVFKPELFAASFQEKRGNLFQRIWHAISDWSFLARLKNKVSQYRAMFAPTLVTRLGEKQAVVPKPTEAAEAKLIDVAHASARNSEYGQVKEDLSNIYLNLNEIYRCRQINWSSLVGGYRIDAEDFYSKTSVVGYASINEDGTAINTYQDYYKIVLLPLHAHVNSEILRIQRDDSLVNSHYERCLRSLLLVIENTHSWRKQFKSSNVIVNADRSSVCAAIALLKDYSEFTPVHPRRRYREDAALLVAPFFRDSDPLQIESVRDVKVLYRRIKAEFNRVSDLMHAKEEDNNVENSSYCRRLEGALSKIHQTHIGSVYDNFQDTSEKFNNPEVYGENKYATFLKHLPPVPEVQPESSSQLSSSVTVG